MLAHFNGLSILKEKLAQEPQESADALFKCGNALAEVGSDLEDIGEEAQGERCSRFPGFN